MPALMSAEQGTQERHSCTQEGSVYVAEVDNGRVQTFRRRAGANPAMFAGTPVYAAWK
jgi:hypothetical protein